MAGREGVLWPPPKAKAGKPSGPALWLRAIYVEVRAGRALPDGVPVAVPCAWLPSDSVSACLSDVEVVAAGDVANQGAYLQNIAITAAIFYPPPSPPGIGIVIVPASMGLCAV